MPPLDLPHRLFKSELQRLGFADRGRGLFADLRRADGAVYTGAVDSRGRLNRRETLVLLVAKRATRDDMRQRAEAAAARRRAFIDRLAPAAMVPPRAGLAEDVAIDRLADDMRQAGQREGGVSRDDLKLLGWTSAQLDALADRARARAQALAGATA